MEKEFYLWLSFLCLEFWEFSDGLFAASVVVAIVVVAAVVKKKDAKFLALYSHMSFML